MIPKIKVCGMRDKKNLEGLISLSPDFIGFIFYHKSPRFAGDNFETSVPDMIPKNIFKVGVFVNAGKTYVEDKVNKYKLDYIQLSGDESVEYCEKLHNKGMKIIKTIRISENVNFIDAKQYTGFCDYFLFETRSVKFGGSGKKFDWEILGKYNIDKPFFLSGGIGPADSELVNEIKNQQLYALDINSRFELSPGLKDIERIKIFIQNIRNK